MSHEYCLNEIELISILCSFLCLHFPPAMPGFPRRLDSRGIKPAQKKSRTSWWEFIKLLPRKRFACCRRDIFNVRSLAALAMGPIVFLSHLRYTEPKAVWMGELAHCADWDSKPKSLHWSRAQEATLHPTNTGCFFFVCGGGRRRGWSDDSSCLLCRFPVGRQRTRTNPNPSVEIQSYEMFFLS